MAFRGRRVLMQPKNKKHQDVSLSPLLETYPNLTPDKKDSKTGAAIPSDADVVAAKRWVEENEL